MPVYSSLSTGDPAPWFVQRSFANPKYHLNAAAGRYIVLCFFGSAAEDQGRAAITAVMRQTEFFDDFRGSFFGVSIDPEDETQRRVANRYPGYRFLWDFDGQVSKLYGSVSLDAEIGALGEVRRQWVVLDPTLRVIKVIPFAPSCGDVAELLGFIRDLPPPSRFPGFEVHAPILVLPNVFEQELCHALIAAYEGVGGEESGYMVEVDGKTTQIHNHHHKRRKDVLLQDGKLIDSVKARILRRVVPEIAKVHQFRATRMERYLVACYAAEDEAHFQAHRDNTTKGTAHRRFAITINLNDAFDGGELCFPEYGPRCFKPPTGCAIVFSCSLLHAVTKVTRGRRFAFLPFLYDDAAAKLREQNNAFLKDVDEYRRELTNEEKAALPASAPT